MDIFARLFGRMEHAPAKRLAVANAADHEVLAALKSAVDLGIVEPVLVGDRSEILTVAETLSFDLSRFEFMEARHAEEAAQIAVSAVASGFAQALMKGDVQTSTLLKAVLDPSYGIRGPGLLSHLACFVLPALDRPVFLSDAAINIAPSIDDKMKIIQNGVDFLHRIGWCEPIVGLLAAVEKVNPKMPATTDAKEIVERQKQFVIKGCQIGGPYALDNALFPEMAKHKGMTDPLAGYADLLIAPDIEAGNLLYKSMSFLAGGQSAGLVIGAKAPIVLTSRSDSEETKLRAIALALGGELLGSE
ncbi:MAG TPA: bifunctional enoyl-CoA hydratase/phosphate acetyltransferase [Fastidiosipila sp.]|nr:bifunctional enoyl-CoA hydratase/phosphate acetyltransferase [Fastidiosipila sp.]